MTRPKMEINRGLFARQVYDSASLTVPTTLFHRLRQEGTYDVRVHRGEQLAHRTTVRVSEQGVPQIDVDPAAGGHKADGDGCCDGAVRGQELLPGGALCFHVSEGDGGYDAVVERVGRDGSVDTVLDSSEAIPAGDVFAVTMVLPGEYGVMLNGEDKEWARVRVGEPDPASFRPAEGTVLTLGPRGLEPDQADLGFGQSVAIILEVDASIQVAPLHRE